VLDSIFYIIYIYIFGICDNVVVKALRH